MSAGFSLTLESSPAERDELIAELWDAGTTGITEEDQQMRAFFPAGADSQALMQQFGLYRPRFEEEEEHDWVRHSQSLWSAFPVGERFWLAPEWDTVKAIPNGRLRLSIRPGMASGSGSHPATRLCLEALEQAVHSESAVLDVGTGSGILAEAAGLLRARFVAGCDIDGLATEVAHRNLPQLPVFTGSLRSVRSDAFDIVVANLNAATLAETAVDLSRVARETLIVSGFREDEMQRVQKRLTRNIRKTMELDDWICIIC